MSARSNICQIVIPIFLRLENGEWHNVGRRKQGINVGFVIKGTMWGGSREGERRKKVSKSGNCKSLSNVGSRKIGSN